ncbi:hypothetical protein [Cohnella thailandensis]|uniref:Uncharacterized protein n=1 Tax=Cohnella thailandensis TaxID=557557 RepID=A0A841SLD0_9BACL|nr:hypothetical protein [Cohnella thailandensis]MBB6632724.1 hypothetical protein [Cohnella thailandensis]MBP1975587.1 outer membrane murein-binding lipoprotein Lpp [Cohnella thailandensis]
MNLDIEAWKQFATDHWVVIAIALVAILVVVNVVKTVAKWALAAVIVIAVLVYGGYSVNDLKEVGSKVSEVGSKATAALLDEAITSMAGEAKDAEYTLNEDGSYTVKTKSITLSGIANSGKVKVTYKGVTFPEVPLDGAVREFVVAAREASQ